MLLSALCAGCVSRKGTYLIDDSFKSIMCVWRPHRLSSKAAALSQVVVDVLWNDCKQKMEMDLPVNSIEIFVNKSNIISHKAIPHWFFKTIIEYRRKMQKYSQYLVRSSNWRRNLCQSDWRMKTTSDEWNQMSKSTGFGSICGHSRVTLIFCSWSFTIYSHAQLIVYALH